MPLTDLQRMVARILRQFRTEHDYVAGGAALNTTWLRLSDDMDIFRDYRNSLQGGVERELTALRDAGFSIEITTNDEWIVEAIVRQYGFETKVQWLNDRETSRRFFPAIDDENLGYRLHQADVAVNKVLCAARRRSAARDAVDLASIVSRYCPLGPLVWAIAGKAPDSPPPQVIKAIRANAFGYSDDEIRTVRMADDNVMTRDELRSILEPALGQANDYCNDVAPEDHIGCLFVNSDQIPVAADLAAISSGAVRVMNVQDFTPVPRIV